MRLVRNLVLLDRIMWMPIISICRRSIASCPTAIFLRLMSPTRLDRRAPKNEITAFISANEKLIGTHQIDGIPDPVVITQDSMRAAAKQFLNAVLSAAEIYRYIKEKKGDEDFITEVSMDETESPQTPVELLIILAALAQHKVPLQTIAPEIYRSL